MNFPEFIPAWRSAIVSSSNSNGRTWAADPEVSATSRAPASAGRIAVPMPPNRVVCKKCRRSGISDFTARFVLRNVVLSSKARARSLRRNYRRLVNSTLQEERLYQYPFSLFTLPRPKTAAWCLAFRPARFASPKLIQSHVSSKVCRFLLTSTL